MARADSRAGPRQNTSGLRKRCFAEPEIRPGDRRACVDQGPSEEPDDRAPGAGTQVRTTPLPHPFAVPPGRRERLCFGGAYHQRPSPSRRMTHSWSPLSAISAMDLPIAWCSGSCVKTWTKTLRHEIVVGSVPICHRWTAVVLRYSRKPGSGKPNVTARRRSLPRLARETIASSRGGTSERRKENTHVIPPSRRGWTSFGSDTWHTAGSVWALARPMHSRQAGNLVQLSAGT